MRLSFPTPTISMKWALLKDINLAFLLSSALLLSIEFQLNFCIPRPTDIAIVVPHRYATKAQFNCCISNFTNLLHQTRDLLILRTTPYLISCCTKYENFITQKDIISNAAPKKRFAVISTALISTTHLS